MLIAAGSLAALSISTAAMAQGDRGKDMFERVDTNGDGVITPAERDAAKLAMFIELDADGNGYVTEEEMKAAQEARRTGMKERMAERIAERRAGAGNEARDRGNPVDRLDTDGDGVISQAEFLAHEPEHLDKVDTDGDGNITRAEADAAREAMRETMKQRWADRKSGKSGTGRED
ncbi:hypothetical protein GCM10011342_14280 [Aquisalinus flavus]|uniref:EF-hand domain-containing protein n=2 Tax=Aquisalinus flavus TaxID=1526572 RepID=A0A8J2Y676_9PROT|nr:hypothetical protein GCM10011342_14280 [Aquisalinus flavus]